ncbi:MAG: Protoheme IX farnesyltransferase [Candidatus Heimdallarchaeota archaeon LC_3]|nr:MAG: Protoheme IX farnesyltransferase [Candidatus Heimdallarchaeota archaeon LC_3]
MSNTTETTNTIDSSPQNGFMYQFNRYFALTKPRIVLLLTITGLIGFLIAGRNIYDLDFVIKLIVAIYMGFASSGGAMAINSYLDRDIDLLMKRTKKRASVNENPINPPEKILIFGSSLVFSSVIIAYFVFNLLTAIFISWGVLFYLFGYSLYLKRKSVLQNIIGGLASPTPVWVGYAAIQNEKMLVNAEAWLLGLLVFVWTISHTWALSSKYHEDYKNANIPVLPVVYGIKLTAQLTFLWIFVVVAYSIIISFWMTNGSIILQILLILPHLIIIYSGFIFLKDATVQTANKCFKTHNFWLAIVFLGIWIFIS